MHTEMKYRFLIHYTLSFIGGYLGLYAIVSRADLFGNAQTANLLGVVRDLIGRNFSDMLLRVGALLIYMAAVILTVWIPEHFSTDLRFISIGIDIFAILLLGFFPPGMSPVVALYIHRVTAGQIHGPEDEEGRQKDGGDHQEQSL